MTPKEIEEKWTGFGNGTAELITGFSNYSRCTLCKAVNIECYNCTWLITGSDCVSDMNSDTYFDISDSLTPTELLTAFRARAAYMRQVLKDGGVE